MKTENLSLGLAPAETSLHLKRLKAVIISEWEKRAAAQVPAAQTQSKTQLIDSLPEFIDELVLTLCCRERSSAVKTKSEIAKVHGEHRSSQPEYSLEEVIYEYHLLRSVIVETLSAESANSYESLSVIHAFIDQGIQKSAAQFVKFHERRNASIKFEREQTRQQLMAAIEVAKVGFFEWDMQKDHFVVNEHFTEDWGIGNGAAIADVLAIVHPDDRAPTQSLIEDAMKTGAPYLAQYRIRRKSDGKLSWIEARGRASRDEQGNLASFFGTTLNFTERKDIESELAFERHKLKTVVENSTASIAVLRGSSFTYELTNKSYAELFNKRELIGRPLLDALPELSDQPFPVHAKSVFATGVPYVEREAFALLKRTKDGPLEERYFDQTYSRILDQKNEPYGIFMHAQEVTDRVVARRELELAKAAAEQANQTKSSFLANMSHEIRTPLGAILGFTDLLRERNLDSKEQEQFLDTISRNGNALTKIIDDILDLAKVESGKLEVEMVEFSLSNLVDEVIDLFRERTRAKNIFLRASFAKDASPRIVSDPTRLRQILINIVGNAVKFTSEGGVTIGIDQELNANGKLMLSISVKDTGVGLAPEQKERLFQPFTQADNSTTRKFGGTGLGLSLSLRLAQALGGNISIEECGAEPGCEFKIIVYAELPKPSMKAAGKDDSENKNSVVKDDLPFASLQILVADDSKDNQFLVEKVLTKFGAVVTLADNGLVAVQKAIEGHFDLVLMDIQMPRMDGYEATRCLRKAGFNKPIIALTAHAMTEERARTLAAGCNGHLTKPLNRAELIATVQKVVRPGN